jgi:ribosome-associated protein
MENKPYLKLTQGDTTYNLEDAVALAYAVALDKKALRPVALDLRSLGAFTECFLILSGQSGRQVSSIAEGIRMFFKNVFGLLPTSVDGYESQNWILLDYGYFFVHIFQEPTRNLYQLEQLWSKAKEMEISEVTAQELYKQALAFHANNQPQ